MRKILVLMVALLLAASSAFAAGNKISFVDTQAVFDKTKLGKKYQGILKEYFESRKKILDLDADEIQKLRDDYGMTFIVISHNMQNVHRIADRIIVLRQGKQAATLDKHATTPEEIVAYITGAKVQAH